MIITFSESLIPNLPAPLHYKYYFNNSVLTSILTKLTF